MAKGIRPYAIATFYNLIHMRGEVGDTKFRKAVMNSIEAQFGCTNAAAASHYNFALQLAKVERPELVQNLGRPEGKNNGGRKRKVATVEQQVTTLLLGWNGIRTDYVDAEGLEPAEYTIKKRKNGDVVATCATLEQAREMCATPNLKVGGKFTGKVYWV